MKTTVMAAILLGVSCAACAADEGITPYRPSVSSPAALPLPGQLEFEAGLLHTEGRGSIPYLFKLAFTPEWGVLLGGEALVSDEGTRGIGDTVLTLKRAFTIDEATAFGLELGAKLPTAREAIGSGKADAILNAILSRDFGAVHMDANLNLTRLGAVDAGTARVQQGASASFSTPINGQWGVTGELSGTRRQGAGTTSQWLAALAYSPDKRHTFDAGLAHGLNERSPRWSFFAGMVTALGKAW